VGFYARALLRGSHDFGLRGLVEAATEQGIDCRVEPASAMDDAGWRDAELWAPQADVPVEIDVSRPRGTRLAPRRRDRGATVLKLPSIGSSHA
jgi:hypothetical protein